MARAFLRKVARVVGAILLTCGFALGALVVLALIHGVGSSYSGLVILLVGVAALGMLCLLLGLRLVLYRPNRHGSLLSPTSWQVLAGFFLILALILAALAIRDREYAIALSIGPAVLFAYACFMAARGKGVGRTFLPGTSLLRMGGFAPPGFRHGVEILNDDRTPMAFVVDVLEKNLGLEKTEAVRMMLAIHDKGGVIVARESLEESQRIAEEVMAAARLGGHPLVCRAVSVVADPAGGLA